MPNQKNKALAGIGGSVTNTDVAAGMKMSMMENARESEHVSEGIPSNEVMMAVDMGR